jgi:hypothetical protein
MDSWRVVAVNYTAFSQISPIITDHDQAASMLCHDLPIPSVVSRFAVRKDHEGSVVFSQY